MRRMSQFAWVLMTLVICLVFVQPGSGREADNEDLLLGGQIRQFTSELLDGRIAIVRVYPDPSNNPSGFEKVRVAITDLLVRPAEIKAAYPAVSDHAFVLLLEADQVDETVAAVLGRRVVMGYYSGRLALSLHLEPGDPDWNPMWTFFDARGDPMPGATVEIRLNASDNRDGILLLQTTLDERSQLARLSPAGWFFFKVSQPDYGAALVQFRLREEDPSGAWVVPLVPVDSPAASSSIQGTVVDNEGHPVPDARIRCKGIWNPDGNLMEPEPVFFFDGVTDKRGWFSLCVPLVGKDLVLKGLPAPGSRYGIEIAAPKTLNLRQHGIGERAKVHAGTESTFTLTPMEAGKTCHTFAFEYYEGPVTDSEELRRIELRLYRDHQEWVQLTADQLKPGYALPPGTLRTMTWRKGRPFSFQDIELTPDSPEHILVRGAEPLFYRGRVVDGLTGEPISGAIVSTCTVRDGDDSGEVTPERWQHLQTLLARAAEDDSLDTLYQMRDRIATTDADGVFEIPFLPGLYPFISDFVIDKPGYEQTSFVMPHSPTTGAIHFKTLQLKPFGGPKYFPLFVFEDEAGLPIDPNEFDESMMTIQDSEGHLSSTLLTVFLKRGQFKPGLYGFEGIRDGKRYLYMPVDLSVARPETVVFTPRLVQQTGLVYQGQVVHGVTGEPIPRAIVVHLPVGVRYDASGLEPSDWAAIEALGPHPDLGDPALAPLLNRLDLPWQEAGPCALTDERGWYRMVLTRSGLGPPDILLAVARDFLGARQRLPRYPRPGADAQARSGYESLMPDENGVVEFTPMKLFPAGTIALYPVIQDLGSNKKDGRLRFRWIVAQEDGPWWVQDLWVKPRENGGPGTFYQTELRPNVSQTVYLPAGLDLRLVMYQTPRSAWPPVQLGSARLMQGQTVKLGHVEFLPGVEVTVKVTDRKDHPLGGVQIRCLDEDRTMWQADQLTDEAGMVTVHVAPHSAGLFQTYAYDRQTGKRLEERTPFQVGGDEDAGRQFTLRLSDEFIAALAQREPR